MEQVQKETLDELKRRLKAALEAEKRSSTDNDVVIGGEDE